MLVVTAFVAAMFRYPVKGLWAEGLGEAHLTPGEGLPLDRCFAVCHGRSTFDPRRPSWRPRGASSRRLALGGADTAAVSVDVDDDEAARREVDAFFTAFLAGRERGPFRLAHARGVMFTDQPDKLVSLVNRASLVELSAHLAAFPDEARFRANLIVDGARPWEELEWQRREVRVGEARLRIVDRIDRCAATTANPLTGQRDLDIPGALQAVYGHVDCGVFAKVVEPGVVRTGDAVIAE